jgi:acetyl-CoA synthetase
VSALDWPTFGREAADVAWRPGSELLTSSRLARFVREVGGPDLDTVQARAASDPAWFWAAAADDIGIGWQRRPTQVLDLARGPEWATWWRGGSYNYAAAAVDPRASRDPLGECLVWEGEDGEVRRFTAAALKEAVDHAAGALLRLGVGPGDRVGLLLPLIPETVIAMLALGRIRAVIVPIFSGYGAAAVADRLGDCEARLLITADGFLRRGSRVPLKVVADEAAALTPSIERVVVVRRLGPVDALAGAWSPARDVWWHDAMADPDVRPLTDVEETDPESPFMLIYTSGTTGKPKGTIHVHGGFPVKAMQDMAHNFDLSASDRLFWLTDIGWMMGPWAIAGALSLGCTLVIYEGAPDHPGPDRIWWLAARHRVTHLGLSPTLVRVLMGHGPEPFRDHDLGSLRMFGSTGEPWNQAPWWWLFREVGREAVPIINYSGGTEMSGGILACNPITPIKPTSFGGPNVGCAADVFDATGLPVRGVAGDLVVTAPAPGMTRGFWRAPERYLATYWERFPGTWDHGDRVVVDADGYWFVLGRSDDTLKVAGKRLGPSEVEDAAVAHRSVLEAAAIGVPDEIKGEVVVVLCVLRPGETDDPDLRAAVAASIERRLGKPLRPERVVVVRSLPKTRSGKVMRRVARSAWLGHDPGDLSGLEDATTIELIRAAATG